MIVCLQWKRWIEPSSRHSAITPTHSSPFMIRSSAWYSMKYDVLYASERPYSVCSIAWPVRSAAAAVRYA